MIKDYGNESSKFEHRNPYFGNKGPRDSVMVKRKKLEAMDSQYKSTKFDEMNPFFGKTPRDSFRIPQKRPISGSIPLPRPHGATSHPTIVTDEEKYYFEVSNMMTNYN